MFDLKGKIEMTREIELAKQYGISYRSGFANEMLFMDWQLQNFADALIAAERQRLGADTPVKVAASADLSLVPKPPNIEGQTLCHVRWIVKTPGGWLGAWDREAFEAYGAAAIAADRERI